MKFEKTVKACEDNCDIRIKDEADEIDLNSADKAEIDKTTLNSATNIAEKADAIYSSCKDCEFTVSGVKRSKMKQKLNAHRNKHHNKENIVKVPSSTVGSEIKSTIHLENPQDTEVQSKVENVLKFEKNGNKDNSTSTVIDNLVQEL